MIASLVSLSYLVAAALFILGIKNLSKPRTAVRGNTMAATGMLIAIAVTLLDNSILSYEWIIGGILLGGAIGATMATRVQMTNMPQMVAVLNGSGGGASLFIALASYLELTGQSSFFGQVSQALNAGSSVDQVVNSVAITLATLIGGVTVSGSFVAWAKLEEKMNSILKGVPGNKVINGILLSGSLVAVVLLAIDPSQTNLYISTYCSCSFTWLIPCNANWWC